MYINKIVITLLFYSCYTFSQTQTDTVYVHEKVFVYKKIKKKPAEISSNREIVSPVIDSLFKEKRLEFNKQDVNFPLTTPPENFDLLLVSNKPPKMNKAKRKDPFSSSINYGLTTQVLFSSKSNAINYGVGFGVFGETKIYKDKLLLELEFSFSEIFNTNTNVDLDGYLSNSGGIYTYKPNSQTKTQQIFPLNFYLNSGKLKPILGVSYTQINTLVNFYYYPNNPPSTTIQESKYNFINRFIDMNFGAKYDFSKRMGIVIKSKLTLYKIDNKHNSIQSSNNQEALKSINYFPGQINISIQYSLRK